MRLLVHASIHRRLISINIIGSFGEDDHHKSLIPMEDRNHHSVLRSCLFHCNLQVHRYDMHLQEIWRSLIDSKSYLFEFQYFMTVKEASNFGIRKQTSRVSDWLVSLHESITFCIIFTLWWAASSFRHHQTFFMGVAVTAIMRYPYRSQFMMDWDNFV